MSYLLYFFSREFSIFLLLSVSGVSMIISVKPEVLSHFAQAAASGHMLILAALFRLFLKRKNVLFAGALTITGGNFIREALSVQLGSEIRTSLDFEW